MDGHNQSSMDKSIGNKFNLAHNLEKYYDLMLKNWPKLKVQGCKVCIQHLFYLQLPYSFFPGEKNKIINYPIQLPYVSVCIYLAQKPPIIWHLFLQL